MSAAPTLVLLAALPRELQGLVRGVAPDSSVKAGGIWLVRSGGVVFAAAGMGGSRVSLAFEAALAGHTPTLVLSVGLAGACTPAYAPGTTMEVDTVVDARTGERYQTHTNTTVTLASVESVASIAEKARLATAYGAGLVDMEAAAVARLARAHGLRFRAIKGISDAFDFELAALARFATPQGQFRTAAFALHTGLRPHTWQTAALLGRNSGRALQSLHQRLREVIAEETGLASNPE